MDLYGEVSNLFWQFSQMLIDLLLFFFGSFFSFSIFLLYKVIVIVFMANLVKRERCTNSKQFISFFVLYLKRKKFNIFQFDLYIVVNMY